MVEAIPCAKVPSGSRDLPDLCLARTRCHGRFEPSLNGEWISPVTPLLAGGERCAKPNSVSDNHHFPLSAPRRLWRRGAERGGSFSRDVSGSEHGSAGRAQAVASNDAD